MPDIKIINPDSLGKPLGQYSQMTRVKASEYLFIAGQLGTDKDGKIVGDSDFDAQCVQTFANIENLDPEFEGMPIMRERRDNVKIGAVLSNSFGFGGTNGTLVFARL